jgi:hypothetical protein
LHGKARWPVDKQECFTKFCPHSLGGSAKKNDVPFPWDFPISVISVPNSSSLGNFFIVKFVIEIPNFLKIVPFTTLPISQYRGFLIENQ